MSIRAIETAYKGYRFRSRLEARWAVFFDAMGIAWEYEPEGYDLAAWGGWYLPDFWLPKERVHLEIKPKPGAEDELERWVNASACMGACTGRPLMLLSGPPEVVPYAPYMVLDIKNHRRLMARGWLFWQEPHGLCWIGALSDGDDAMKELVKPDGGWFVQHLSGTEPPTQYDGKIEPQPKMERAVEAARSARFEHGETPVV